MTKTKPDECLTATEVLNRVVHDGRAKDPVAAAIAFANHPSQNGAGYTLEVIWTDGTVVDAAVVGSGPGWVMLQQFYAAGPRDDPRPFTPWQRFYRTEGVHSAEVKW